MINATPEQIRLVAEWRDADNNARLWKQREAELRKLVLSACFSLAQDTSAPEDYAGTDYLLLNEGWRLKRSCSLDYKLDNKDNQVDMVLERFPAETGEMLVKWTPELSVSNYKLLASEQQRLFAPALTIRNAAPKFEIVAPKKG